MPKSPKYPSISAQYIWPNCILLEWEHLQHHPFCFWFQCPLRITNLVVILCLNDTVKLKILREKNV